MNSMFYIKLAFTNLKKNARTYVPYLLSCIGTIAMFYMMHTIASSDTLSQISIGRILQSFLYMGVGIIGFFAILFLFYTNSFLVKKRKKEFGLFNILGMEKIHIAKVLFFETIYTAIISMALGIGLGSALGKMMHLLLLRILNFDVQFGFSISMLAIKNTLILFGIIFLLSYLNTLRQIQLAKPIDLLKGGNQGEKEPKAKWIVAIIGFICIFFGYRIALTVQNPVAVITELFLAIILVMIGTYCLFTAGSIVVLKLLRKNKRYYYKAKHFTSVSGMIYRMKQNAAGLANICILSTGVLLSVSTTVSLYAGLEDMLMSRYSREIVINDTDIQRENVAKLKEVVADFASERQMEIKRELGYQSISLTLVEKDGIFQRTDISRGIDTINDLALTVVLPLEDYNQMTKEEETLEEGEVLLCTMKGEKLEGQIQFGEEVLKVKRVLEELELDSSLTATTEKTYVIVVPTYEKALQMMRDYSYYQYDQAGLNWYYGFDIELDSQEQIAFKEELSQRLSEVEFSDTSADQGFGGYVEAREENRKEFYALYGSLFFLGIFLGVLFLMATVLIIYYKQISEGYEDRERFVIMQKVGMSHREVKRSIHSQILLVFFLPLLTAVIHTAFAFPIFQKLLVFMGLSNASIFRNVLIATILIFTAFYAWIYNMTARTYYKIVSQK